MIHIASVTDCCTCSN